MSDTFTKTMMGIGVALFTAGTGALFYVLYSTNAKQSEQGAIISGFQKQFEQLNTSISNLTSQISSIQSSGGIGSTNAIWQSIDMRLQRQEDESSARAKFSEEQLALVTFGMAKEAYNASHKGPTP